MDRIRRLLEDLLSTANQAVADIDRRLAGLPLLLKRSLDSYNAHDGPFTTAAMAYYFFFTLFPLVLALIAVGSLFIETTQAREAVIGLVARALPVFQQTIARTVDLVLAQRGPIGIVATLSLIYSASGLFGVLLAVVNRTWACVGARPSYIQRLLAIALVVALVPFFFLLAFATTGFEALSRSGFMVGLGMAEAAAFFTILSALFSIAVASALFLFLYWKLPATTVYFADAWPAALAAGIAWEGARQLYALYLALVAQLALVYGSVAAIIGLLGWFNLTAFIILLGAELSAQIAEGRGRGPSACAT